MAHETVSTATLTHCGASNWPGSWNISTLYELQAET